jgi:hypothetical protein
MAEQADIYVKNEFASDIVVTRILPDEISSDTTIPSGDEDRFYLTSHCEEKFPLVVSEELLIINAPDGVDTEDCYIIVRSSIIDLAISFSSTNWTIRIVPNELPPEVPTSVNVTVGPL